jgi:hypothetical protein
MVAILGTLHRTPSPSPVVALLDIHTKPPRATLHVDGNAVGTAPILRKIPPGKHRIQANLDGYQSKSLSVDLQPGQSLPVTLELAPIAAMLDIRTTPPGAELFLDGRPVGTAPAALPKIKPGKHVVQASLNGYQSKSLSVDLQPGQSLPVDLELAPLAAVLDIRTTPPGAELFLDDRPVGTAPATLRTIPPGNHRLQASLAGYQSKSLSVDLQFGQSVPVTLKLAAISSPSPQQTKPDIEGVVEGAMSASMIKVGNRWIELYGIDDPTRGRHGQAVAGYLGPARGRVECYRKASGKYQCYSGGQDLALLALRDGIARLARDAPDEYREAEPRQQLRRKSR